MLVNNIYQISNEPRIFLGIGSKHWGVLSGTPENNAYMITHPMWYFNLKGAYMLWKLKLDLKKRNVELIILHNTPYELFISKIAGLSGYFYRLRFFPSSRIGRSGFSGRKPSCRS